MSRSYVPRFVRKDDDWGDERQRPRLHLAGGAAPIVAVTGVDGDRPGTYTVTVRQAGYQPWSQSGLEVEDGTCGVRTVEVTARLQPAG